MSDIEIECEKIRTPHKLLWTESDKKWRINVTNNTNATIYISWAESFVNPFTNDLWIKSIDQSPQAADRMLAELQGGKCTSFKTAGDPQRQIAPERFVEVAIPPGTSASWVMERVHKAYWEGFNIYSRSLAESIEKHKAVPIPKENILPKIRGWWWA